MHSRCDEDSTDGIDAILDLIRNTPLVDLVLLNPASVRQPDGVKYANLGMRLRTVTTFTKLTLTVMPFLLVSL